MNEGLLVVLDWLGRAMSQLQFENARLRSELAQNQSVAAKPAEATAEG